MARSRFAFLPKLLSWSLTHDIFQVDASMLDPSCLVPPTIPNTLGAEDIDKVRSRLYCKRVSSYIGFQGDCCSDQRADSGDP